MHHEIEIKFQVPEPQRASVAARFARTEPLRLQAHYVDTPGGALARHGLALRLRREGDHWVQTLKAGRGVRRLEHEVALDDDGDAVPLVDPERHRGSPAHEALQKALKTVRREGGDDRLVEVFGTEVERRRRVSRQGGAEVEIAFDQGRVVAGPRSATILELEFELKGGPLSALFEAAAGWVEPHALWRSSVNKAERGHLLAAHRLHSPATKAGPPRVDEAMDARAFARAAVASCLEQILPNASVVAEGGGEAEHVHQLRIGLRRLRVVLREMAAFDCGLDGGWEAPLAEAFRALGAERDQSLLDTRTAAALAEAGAPELARPRLHAGEGDPAALVRSTAFQQALLAAEAFSLDASPASAPAWEGEPLAALCDRLDALHGSLGRRGRKFDTLPPERQHRVRKQLKRLRYLAELVAPCFDAKAVRRGLRALQPAQDALGEHQDLAVALQAYRAEAEAAPEAWFAVGWLQARLDANTLDARRALREAVRERPFWRS